VLQRGDIGTAETNDFGPIGYGEDGIYQAVMRAPHLMIWERDISGDDNVEQVVSVWLCAKDSGVVFDTVDELLAAIQTELDRLSDASTSQLSGDDSTGNPRQELWFDYVVSREGICVAKTSDDSWWYPGGIKTNETRQAMIGGVIPVVFGLSHPSSVAAEAKLGYTTYKFSWASKEKTSLRRDEVAKRLAFPGQYNVSLGDRGTYTNSGPIGTFNGKESLGSAYWQFIPPSDKLSELFEDSWRNLEKKQTEKIKDYKRDVDFYPRYYYEFSRDDDLDPAVSTRVVDNTGVYGAPLTSGNPRMWLERIEGHQPVIGATLALCDAEGMPKLEGEIDASGEDEDYFYVDISSTAPDGTGIALSAATGSPSPPRGTFNVISWIRSQSAMVDPWAVSQGASAVSGDDIAPLFRAVLGADDNVQLANSQTLFWVPDVGAVEDEEQVSWIDWDDLEDKVTKIFRDEHYIYRPGRQNFLNTFTNFLRSHSLVPYLELVKYSGYDLWKMRFRPVGVVNYTDAVVFGRSLSNDTFMDDYDVTRDVASGFIYSGIKLKLNFDGEESGAEIEIADKSAYAQNGYASKIYTIDDRVTHCPRIQNIATDKGVQGEIAGQYTSGMLPHLSRPRPISTAKCTTRSMLLPVGGDVVVTDQYGKNPFTGAIGYTGLAGLVTALDVDLDKMSAKCSWRLARSVSKGWAPALYLPGGTLTESPANTWTVALGGTPSASAHEFSGSTDQTDWSRFDCWDYDRLTSTYGARSCSCDDYAVRIFRCDRPLDTVWYGTARVTGLQPGGTPAMTLYIVADLPTAFPMILEFGLYDDAESCQRELAVAYCDDDGYIGTADYPADTWV
jgi:hypothetical protein